MDIREGLRGIRGVLLWGLLILTVAVLLSGRHARAGDPQFWGNYPPEVHEWFPTVMQPGFEDMHDSGHSCCGETDAFEARVTGDDQFGNISVTIDDGKSIIPDGTEVSAPKSKIQTHYGNPFPDKVIVFISIGDHKTVFCLIPNTGI